jgi:hypothetical protein
VSNGRLFRCNGFFCENFVSAFGLRVLYQSVRSRARPLIQSRETVAVPLSISCGVSGEFRQAASHHLR